MADLNVNLVKRVESGGPGAHKTIRVSRLCCGELRTVDISLRRTIRVPDNKTSYELPPDLGAFPNVEDFGSKLPPSIVETGGLFMPIYQREAMWINFFCHHPFAVKIMVGGVNAVSGEDRKVDVQQMITRQQLRVAKGKSAQDYLVPPLQLWLDGVATGDGYVRQFVASPVGCGYSVEAQTSGDDNLSGIQFEITPKHLDSYCSGTSLRPELPVSSINVQMSSGKLFSLQVAPCYTIGHLKKIIQDRECIPNNQQRLSYPGIVPEDGDEATLTYCGIGEGSTVYVAQRLRGGGSRKAAKGYPLKAMKQLTLAAGGTINQVINTDEGNPKSWDADKTILFNLQLLDATLFKQILGIDPPETPVTATTYAQHGYPFFKLYEQLSGVYGDFGLKSMGNFDKEIDINSSIHEEEENLVFASVGLVRNGTSVVRLNTVDKKTEFVPVEELAIRLQKSTVQNADSW